MLEVEKRTRRKTGSRFYISIPPTFVLESSKPNVDIRVTQEELNEVAQRWINRYKAGMK